MSATESDRRVQGEDDLVGVKTEALRVGLSVIRYRVDDAPTPPGCIVMLHPHYTHAVLWVIQEPGPASGLYSSARPDPVFDLR